MIVDIRARTEFLSYYTGDYDTAQIDAVLRLFQRHWQVLDVGAHIGYYTVPMASKLTQLDGHVYSFEPVAANLARLRSNVALNGLDSAVTVFPLGLSDRKAVTEISLRTDFLDGASTGNAAIVDHDDGMFERLSIELDTLDSVCDAQRISRVDFIKVDIEGHEDFFLNGARKTIRAYRPIILAEMNEDYFKQRQVDLDDRIRDVLIDFDYRYLASDRDAIWSEVTSLTGRGASDDILLVPTERVEGVCQILNQA